MAGGLVAGWHRWGPSPAAQPLHPFAIGDRGVRGRQPAGLALLGGLTLLSPFGAWLKEFWGGAGWPRPQAARFPSWELFLLCDAPRASRCGEEDLTLMGLWARGTAAAGTPACCSLAAPTDEFPPCWVVFGGSGARLWALGALPLPCAAAERGVPRILPGGTSGTPALPRVPGARRDGVGARCVAPQPGVLGRAGDLGGGSRVLQGERDRGGCTEPPRPPASRDGTKSTPKSGGFGVRSRSAPHLPEGTLRGCAGSR